MCAGRGIRCRMRVSGFNAGAPLMFVVALLSVSGIKVLINVHARWSMKRHPYNSGSEVSDPNQYHAASSAPSSWIMPHPQSFQEAAFIPRAPRRIRFAWSGNSGEAARYKPIMDSMLAQYLPQSGQWFRCSFTARQRSESSSSPNCSQIKVKTSVQDISSVCLLLMVIQ